MLFVTILNWAIKQFLFVYRFLKQLSFLGGEWHGIVVKGSNPAQGILVPFILFYCKHPAKLLFLCLQFWISNIDSDIII